MNILNRPYLGEWHDETNNRKVIITEVSPSIIQLSYEATETEPEYVCDYEIRRSENDIQVEVKSEEMNGYAFMTWLDAGKNRLQIGQNLLIRKG